MGVSASSRSGSRWRVRALPDGALVLALAGVAAALARAALLAAPAPAPALSLALLASPRLLLAAGAAAVAALALLLALASAGTAAWLSKAHLAPHGTAAATALSALRHRRNVGRRMPCPFPDAWYAVALSAELAPGAIVDVTVCGRSLVVFRPRDGSAPAALDAYCTHTGSHLAHGGGRLEADGCVRCPFHGWCFDSKGHLVRTETGDAPPKGADLRAWPVLERNGVVSVWMAASGHRAPPPSGSPVVAAPGASAAAGASAVDRLAAALLAAAGSPPAGDAADDEKPWFTPPVFPELDGGAGAFAYHGFSEHIVPALIYELPENGADVGHLTALHSDFVVAALRPLLSHKWAGKWTADEEPGREHLASLRIVESMVLLGVTLPGPVKVEITQCGPSQVFLSFNVPGIGRVFIIETVTPVAPTTQRVLHAVYAAPHVPRVAAKALLASVGRAYEQDLPVWAHKRYEPAPRLTASEGSVAVYRKWVRKFYKSPNAISFEEAAKAQLKVDLGLPDDSTMSW